MPHPIQDSGTYLSRGFKFTDSGIVYVSGSQIWKSGITKRPASVKTPKIYGYRQPRNWYAVVFRMEVSEATITWTDNTSGLKATAEGQIGTFNDADAWQYVVLDPILAGNVLRTCLSQMLEDDVAFNAFLLQGKQSLKMVTNLATGLAHGVDNFMQTNWKEPKRFKRFLAKASDDAISKFSGKYLEYLYGWAPLADDVQNAFQSMLDGYTGPNQKRFRLRVRKAKKVRSQLVIRKTASTYWTAPFWWEQTMDVENYAKVILNYEFPSQVGEMLPTMTPFGTAWELAPWSFVVDWFIPVGDWIGAMEATQYAIYMQNAVLTQSVKVTSRRDGGSRWTEVHDLPGNTLTFSKPPSISGQFFQMTREVLSPLQVLDRIKFPDFSSKFGLPQASQALALLSQVLNKWS